MLRMTQKTRKIKYIFFSLRCRTRCNIENVEHGVKVAIKCSKKQTKKKFFSVIIFLYRSKRLDIYYFPLFLVIPFRHSCLATDCYSWVCWFLRHRGGPVYYPRVLYSFWKKESTKERKKRSKVTWERIYMCIPVYLIWSIFSRCGWPSVYKRYTHIGSHALSPLRELPLSGCDPPESFQQEEGKNLNNRKMEKKKYKIK